MSRSGYSEDCDSNELGLWRGAVESAIQGRRGQAFLKEMLAALDALPEKKLITDELELDGAVCAIGAVGKARGTDMKGINPEDANRVADIFNIAPAMAREIVYENDEGVAYWVSETPEQRYDRMRRWVESNIKKGT